MPPPCGDTPPPWCCRRRLRPSCPLEKTGTGEDPDGRPTVPLRLWIKRPDLSPTGLKRPDGRDEPPNPRPRHLTRSVGRETPGRETPRKRGEEGGATTGGPEDKPRTPVLEPEDLTDPKNGGGRAGETSSSDARQAPGEPAKKARPAARAINSREARRRTEMRRQLTAAWRFDPATEKP